ncbi:pyroglutamyl-peptidase 1-like [Dysidea avara]|uniref:pyroglutamyl-peptidase 1-like n=1 Tax=Dysidea avara TaxID=196820 RepID=UPI00332C1DB8
MSRDGPILLTGYGPFAHHKVNGSWVVVQELNSIGVKHKDETVPLVIKEIPVVYDAVHEQVPKLWSEHKPRLCIHTGVSHYTELKIEQYARNSVYFPPDVNGKCPEKYECEAGGPIRHETTINVQLICDGANKRQNDVTVLVSQDAGNYLCEFIYYKSLHVGTSPTLFVHFPTIGKPYTSTQMAIGLKHIVETILDNEMDKM